MASQNVKVTFTMRGEDRASAAINKAGRSADQTSGKMQALGKAALAAGAGFAAIGAAAMAVKRMAEMAEQAARLRAQLDFAGGGKGGFERIIKLSDTIGGVSAQSVGRFAASLRQSGVRASFTADQLRKLTGVALSVGKTGDDAMTALAQAIETGNVRALKQIGIFINGSRVQKEYADRLGKTTSELTALEMRTATVAAVQAKLNSATETSSKAHARLDTALADLNNRFVELKAAVAGGASPVLSALVRQMSAATKAAVNLAKAMGKIGGGASAPGKGGGAFGAVARFFGAGQLTEAAQKRVARLRELQRLRDLPSGGTAEQVQAAGAFFRNLGGLLGNAGRAASDFASRAGSGARGFTQKLAKRRHAAKPGDAEMRKFLRGGSELDDAKVWAQMAQDEIKAEQKRVNAIGAAMRAEMDLEAKRDMFKQAMHDRDQQRTKQRIESGFELASSLAGSVSSIMATFGAQEAAMRLQAGVEAAIAFGKGMVAVGEGRIPQAAALFAGSAALAAQAVGPGASAGSGSRAGQFFGGASSLQEMGPGTVGAGGGGFGGGRVVNVNFGNGVVLGNPHDVARTIKGALAASAGTGF